MPIKIYRENRAARKQASMVDRSALYRGEPHRPLVQPKQRRGGRQREGKMTVRHRGGGARRAWRIIDFGQDKVGVPARVERLEFDPNRSAFVALLAYADGDRRYRLAWHGARAGDVVVAQPQAPEQAGNRLQLQHVTPGTAVHDVELKPGRGCVPFPAAGASAVVLDVQGERVLLKAPSGELRQVPGEAFATVGAVSNPDHRLVRAGSAGRRRRLGWRPAVRGKAMNPVDHPHGGGEGAQPIGLKAPKTRWGRPALGVPTRRRGKYSNSLIVQRRLPKRRS